MQPVAVLSNDSCVVCAATAAIFVQQAVSRGTSLVQLAAVLTTD
jgi:hypothetical protein